MKRDKAIRIALNSAEDGHSYVVRALDESWSLADRWQWMHFARRDLAEGCIKFLERNMHHDYCELFLPLSVALQQLRLSLDPHMPNTRSLWDVKRTLEELQLLCTKLMAELRKSEGGAA